MNSITSVASQALQMVSKRAFERKAQIEATAPKPIPLEKAPTLDSAKSTGKGQPLGSDRRVSPWEEFQKSFGSVEGDSNFQARYDLNSDGEIGPSDFAIINQLRNQVAQTQFERFNQAFGSSEGDKNFNERFDFDKDGEIGPSDFNLLSQATSRSSSADLFELFERSFGAEKSDENYRSSFDFNQDGAIDASDFSKFSGIADLLS